MKEALIKLEEAAREAKKRLPLQQLIDIKERHGGTIPRKMAIAWGAQIGEKPKNSWIGVPRREIAIIYGEEVGVIGD